MDPGPWTLDPRQSGSNAIDIRNLVGLMLELPSRFADPLCTPGRVGLPQFGSALPYVGILWNSFSGVVDLGLVCQWVPVM